MEIPRLFVREGGFIKKNMLGDEGPTRGGLVAFILLVFVTIGHKNTWESFWVKFVVHNVPSIWVAFRPQRPKEMCSWDNDHEEGKMVS